MASRQSVLYIACEGPTCSGKSTALETLSKTQDHSNFETISKRWPETFEPTLDFFLKQDEDKYQRAQKSLARFVFLDRGYLSTLVYYSIFENGRYKEEVLRWMQDCFRDGRLRQPDYYLYFNKVELSQIQQRALRRGRPIDKNNVWYYHPQQISAAYEHYFASLECNVPVYRIDANQEPHTVVEEILTFLAKLNGGRHAR